MFQLLRTDSQIWTRFESNEKSRVLSVRSLEFGIAESQRHCFRTAASAGIRIT